MAINQELKNLIDRIKYEQRINQGEIAERLDVSKTYLSDLINGRAPMNDTFLDRIRTTFGNIEDKPEQHSEILKNHTMYGTPSEAMITLPLIPIGAIAGFPGGDNAGITYSQCEQYAVPEFNAKGADFLIRVSGDSMLPTYKSGDLLACKKIKEITFFQWGTVYVIDTQQGALVKRLFPGKTDKNITCKSDNFELYPEFSIDKTEMRSLSIVIGVIRLE